MNDSHRPKSCNKHNVVRKVSARTGLSQETVRQVIQAFFDEVTCDMARGNRLELREFGIFSVKQRPARMGRNPQTGESVVISSRRVAHFKPGKEMKARVMDESAVEQDQPCARGGHNSSTMTCFNKGIYLPQGDKLNKIMIVEFNEFFIPS
ncbi:MAG: HU family DNA-binding protein [Planctomycetota bacterium]